MMNKRYVRDGKFAGDVLVHEGKTIFNPTPEQLLAAGFTEYEEPMPTLEDARAAKMAEIDAYDMSEAVNGFTLAGEKMWIGFEERQRIRASIQAYRSMGRNDMTKWFAGKEYTYTLDVWESMINAVGVYASEALNVTELHRAAVSALGSIGEVEAYDHTIGYPEKLVL